MNDESMIIQLQHINRRYKMGDIEILAINDISLNIKRGEFVSIMGPSGSGKSTLMNIIGCLDKPTEGVYLLNGKPVSRFNEDQLAEVRNRSIGFVFQTFNLLHSDTALHNVQLPMVYAGIGIAKRTEIAKNTLADVNLSHRIYHRPSEMSGGERQRVAIARALVNNPPIILADEPTGNLDSKTGNEIMKIFHNLSESGKTIILVTHDPDVGMHAHRVIHIKDGVVERDEKVD